MNDARAADRARPLIRTVDAAPSRPEALDAAPWHIFRLHARSIGAGVAACLLVLLMIELAVFRSGVFASHVAISDAQWPPAKLALAARQTDARVLYVGDSTMMTSVMPTVVSATCDCGPGFNGGFSSANPWLTEAMTRRLLGFSNPRLVVISVSPWNLDRAARFRADELARQVMSPDELAALGTPLNLEQSIDAGLGTIWSAYAERDLLKEWVSALAPGQRYNESLRGYYVAPGSANSYARLVAAAGRLFEDVGQPSATAPGAVVIASLVEQLRARGIAVAFLEPPLHDTAYAIGGRYLEQAEIALGELASQHAVPLIDCRSVVSSSDFRDVTHLLPPAAERHSVCVGTQIRSLVHD
jgi:hypothetical protein